MQSQNKNEMLYVLDDLATTYYLKRNEFGELSILSEETSKSVGGKIIGILPKLDASTLGSKTFKERYQVKYAYMAGSMANGISSEKMVIALNHANILSSFGAAGLIPARLEKAINDIKSTVVSNSYAFNLIHSPTEEALEKNCVDLYLKNGIQIVEASAYMNVTPYLVLYKASGLKLLDGKVHIGNRIIAKVSRLEVAKNFMEPAPIGILKKLVDEGKITVEQAELAQKVSLADDITVEADSGGHTDNRPLNCILPAIISLRDNIVEEYNYSEKIHVGAAGGIGTPTSAFGAFALGADYVVTGSINQACIESGSSDIVRKMLCMAEMTDITMAPAADMFEMGVKLQVLKKGTMFSNRANKLYELYKTYESIDDIPDFEKVKLENQIFKKSLNDVWLDTIAFFKDRDLELLESAKLNPKIKMALVFRWYLGLSSRWANQGEKGRELDYQIWCGAAMGAFNRWARNTPFEIPENRKVVSIADAIMNGAASMQRNFELNNLINSF